MHGTRTSIEMDALLDDLRADPNVGRAVLERLVRHPDPVVRSWVPWAARMVLETDAAAAITRVVAQDQDADTRDVAIEELLELDPDAAAELAPALRQRLKSKDLYEPVSAMWTLAAIHDQDALDEIRELSRNARLPWHQKSAFVVSLVLSDQVDEIVRRIRDHDHDLMPWLPEAARLVGTPDARAALKACSDSAPDEECRGYCNEALAKLERSDNVRRGKGAPSP